MTKAAFLPESWRGGPFLDLLETALTAQGVEIVRLGSDYLGIRWLFQKRKQIDVLHFHWLEYHYRGGSAWASCLGLAKIGAKLLLIRLLGYRVVWTMHNVLPHERSFPAIDYLASFLMAHLAHSVIVHCEEGRRQLWRVYRRRRRVFMAYLPHFMGAYPVAVDREQARARLGIGADRRVYLFFGAVRPYKGLEPLIAAFQSLPDPANVLLIVGPAFDSAFGDSIVRLAQGDVRIQVKIGWVPNDELPMYFGAADVAVCPFTHILTSASVLTAFGFGRPVIAPAIGCLPEVVTPGVGLLYDAGKPEALGQALAAAMELDLQAMGRRAREWVTRFTWEDLARETVRASED